MIEAARRHSRLHRNLMLDWLRACDETGAPFPSQEAIAERFQYASVETARTLLADLADNGDIRIDRNGVVSLRGEKRAPIASAPRPIPSVVKKSARRLSCEAISLEQGIDRALKALRERRVAAPKPPRIQKPEPQAVTQIEVAPPAVAPEPAAVASAPAPVAASDQRPPRRKGPVPQYGEVFNLRLHPELLDRLTAAAAARKMRRSEFTREIIVNAMSEQTVPLPKKPVVPVAVLLASIEAGRGLHEFVAELIGRGLRDWQIEHGEAVG